MRPNRVVFDTVKASCGDFLFIYSFCLCFSSFLTLYNITAIYYKLFCVSPVIVSSLFCSWN